MEYTYSAEEQVFREQYYERCGFGNTLFTDLPFNMQPPKIRNELKAVCDALSIDPQGALLTNEITVGQYIGEYPEFYERLKDAEGIKEYKLNRDYCISRNAYDDAREMQVNGINKRIQQMLEKASDLDREDLMEQASERDRITVDILSETVADLNQVLGQTPDQKADVQKGLRKNSVHSIGEHFGLDMETKPEAFRRLEKVFDSKNNEGYPPFMTGQMRSVYPDSAVYSDFDKSYMVESMKEEKMVASVVSTLDSDSPAAVYQQKYGENVFENIKTDPSYSDLVTKYRDALKRKDTGR